MSSIGIDKKEKKMKKAKEECVETPIPMRIEKKSKKESKKRKALDMDVNAGDRENRSEPLNNAKPNSELEVQKTKKKSKKDKVEQEEKKTNGEEETPKVVSMTKKKSKKAKVEEEEKKKNVEGEKPNAVSQFRISQPLRAKLKERGVESLSPIQAMTFDTILDGFDLMGQASAGQDKTLAFVLPILESLINGSAEQSKKTGYRAPTVIVLLPTRDLAIQVLKEFGFYGGSLGIVSCCVYGGSSHKVQTKKLKRGRVDIIVGTPGRVKDQIEKGNIDLSNLKFRVLGEADEMSKKGLVEHVEFILGKEYDVTKVQTLLFSTTMPHWVEEIAPSRYLKSNYKKVDLVGNEKMKASQSHGGFSDKRNDRFSSQGGTVRSNYGNRW
ncbi:DEAD-box ATP-dependent RNA helicase 7 [Rosa sericea]